VDRDVYFTLIFLFYVDIHKMTTQYSVNTFVNELINSLYQVTLPNKRSLDAFKPGNRTPNYAFAFYHPLVLLDLFT